MLKIKTATRRLTKIDKKWLALGILIYTVLSFINLGALDSPQSFFDVNQKNESIVLDLQTVQAVDKIRVYTGARVGTYSMYVSNDNSNYRYIGNIDCDVVFNWKDTPLIDTFRYIKLITLQDTGSIGEIGLWNEKEQLILVKPVDNVSQVVVDEQQKVPGVISYLNSMYFDEIYHARTAYEYVHGLDIYEWTHPPLGKLIIAFTIKYWKMTPFVYRLMGNIAGILMLIVIYLFAKKLFKRTEYAATAAILLGVDGLHFVQTRIATVDSFLVLFILLSFFFMYEYTICDSTAAIGSKLWRLTLSGIFLGAALATKWSACYAALGLMIVFFWDLYDKNKKQLRYSTWKSQRAIIIGSCVLFFIIIPIGIYLASYIPFFHTYQGSKTKLDALIDLQKQMYTYHTGLESEHPFSSPWYMWPFDIKPVWYYKGSTSLGYISSIVAFGNPIIWWSGILAVLFSFLQAIIKRKKEDIFLLIVILSLYLPYMLIPRIMFLYHYFPVVPFLILLITKCLKDITETSGKTIIMKVYVVICVLCFMFFYPIYTGLSVPTWYAMLTRWLPTWQFY